MMPKQREVDLSKGPVLDIVFTQFKANILVKVFCIGMFAWKLRFFTLDG